MAELSQGYVVNAICFSEMKLQVENEQKKKQTFGE